MMFIVILLLSHFVFYGRCGTCLYRFLILAAFLTLNGRGGDGCITLFVFLVSHNCCVDITHDATGLSAVCDCGIS